MTKQDYGKYMQFGAYGALAVAALVAAHHPAIIMLLVVGAAAFLFGRLLEQSV